MRRPPLATFFCMTLLVVGTLVSTTRAAADPVITAAGDIAAGGDPSAAQRHTARLVEQIDPKAVLVLGDNQYSNGAYADYLSSYDPTWGRFEAITHPTPGNHDYHTTGAAGYFKYFGYRAHRANGGYYSFDIGAWHIVAVNSAPASSRPPSSAGSGPTCARTGRCASSRSGITLGGPRAPTMVPTRTWRRCGPLSTVPASTWS